MRTNKKSLVNKLYGEVVVFNEETIDWYRMSPMERFIESQKLWNVFILFKGSYEPESDTQSPFHIFQT